MKYEVCALNRIKCTLFNLIVPFNGQGNIMPWNEVRGKLVISLVCFIGDVPKKTRIASVHIAHCDIDDVIRRFKMDNAPLCSTGAIEGSFIPDSEFVSFN